MGEESLPFLFVVPFIVVGGMRQCKLLLRRGRGLAPSRGASGEGRRPYSVATCHFVHKKLCLTDCPISLYNRFIRYTICRIARRCYKVFTTHGQEREREAVTMSDYAAIEKEARIFTEECHQQPH